VIILVSVFHDVKKSIAKRTPVDRFVPAIRFMDLARQWTLVLLVLAIAISIPPLNSLVHGTHVIMAHAMGSEIGIDSFILFALIAFLFAETFPRCWATQEKLASESMSRTIDSLNLSLVAIFAWLMVSGVTVGLTRASSQPAPVWLSNYTPLILVGSGGLLAFFVLQLLFRWLPFLINPSSRRTREQDQIPS